MKIYIARDKVSITEDNVHYLERYPDEDYLYVDLKILECND